MSVRLAIVDVVFNVKFALKLGAHPQWEMLNWLVQHGFEDAESTTYVSAELQLSREQLKGMIPNEFYYHVGSILQKFEAMRLNEREGKRREYVANLREKRETAIELGVVSDLRWDALVTKMRALELIE